MLYPTTPDFSRQEYTGFVDDHARLARAAARTLENVAHAPKIPAARAALPRPAQYKGRNPPSSRRMAWLHVAGKQTPRSMVKLLNDWTQDRFSPDKYHSLVLAAQTGESELEKAVESLTWDRGRLFLDHLVDARCWAFGLSENETEFAAGAMTCVRTMVDDALWALDRAAVGNGGDFGRLCRWFFYNRGPLVQSELNAIGAAFRKVQQALLSSQHSVVLCKADTRLAGGRTSEAYVKPGSVQEGALIFLGNSFFGPAAKGYAGTELKLYRAATLVHELTHLMAGTEDVAGDNSYGRLTCSAFASAMQRQNADNYGLFAFEVARTMVFGQGRSVMRDMDFVLNEYKL